MKIFSILILISAATVFAQQNKSNPTLELEQEIKNFPVQNDLNNLTQTNSVKTEKKSTGLAILYSLLLPGMGELYADGFNSGRYFTIAEGILWGTYIGMSVYANSKENDYKAFASTFGSVNTEGKDEKYFATIGEYDNINYYNDQKALERNFDQMYNSLDFFWEWQSTKERRTYRSMWSSSEQTYNDLRFVVGAMILNRVASAINAVRLVSSYNSRMEEEISWNISVGLKNNINLPTSINLNFQASF